MSHVDYTMQYGEDEEPKEVETISLHHNIRLPFFIAAQGHGRRGLCGHGMKTILLQSLGLCAFTRSEQNHWLSLPQK